MNEVTIRKAVPGDAEAIVALWEEMMDFHRQRDTFFTQSEDGAGNFERFILQQMDESESCVLVADAGGQAAGYCLAVISEHPPVFVNRRFGSIFDLAVTASRRNQGVGEMLVRRAEAWFGQRDIHRIEVRVAVANEVSMPFWRKMGYAPYVETMYRRIDGT